MGMPIFLRVVQYIGFISSTFSNFLLIFLILTKTSGKMGAYKNLMLVFSVYLIFYACIGFCVQPVMHSKGAMFLLFVDSFFKDYQQLSIILLSIYVGTFGLCISVLAAHFFYRYLAICHPTNLFYLEGFKLLKIYIPGILMSSIWSLGVYIMLKPTEVKSNLLSEALLLAYDIDIYHTPYISLLYYHRGPTKKLIINWGDWSIFLLAVTIMGTCIITMIICGLNCYNALEKVSNISRRTKDLNRQLFRTLIVQTLVPFCTLFTPVAVLFTIPIFSIELGTLANAPGLYLSIYPALDALIVIFMIKDFREILLCRHRKPDIAMTSTFNDATKIPRSYKFKENSIKSTASVLNSESQPKQKCI